MDAGGKLSSVRGSQTATAYPRVPLGAVRTIVLAACPLRSEVDTIQTTFRAAGTRRFVSTAPDLGRCTGMTAVSQFGSRTW
jgi:hypothetical protein